MALLLIAPFRSFGLIVPLLSCAVISQSAANPGAAEQPASRKEYG
jgi:hypothetical protein